MGGALAKPPALGGEKEEGECPGDTPDAKPDRRGRFLLFGSVCATFFHSQIECEMQ